MSASDARPFPLKNTAYRVTFPILDADGDLVTGATGLDSEVSKDGGTFADCTNEATEIATSSGVYFLDVSSTEMNADTVALIIKTSTSGAKTTVIVLYPVEGGDIDVDVTHINGSAVSTSTAQLGVNVVNAAGTAWGSGAITSGVFASGAITATAIAADAIGASELAADAVAELADAVWDEARSGHVSAGTFGEGVVVNSIAAGAITAAAVATGAIDADAIADGAIDAGAIATGAITSAKFAAGAIDAAAVATGAIDADALAADAGTEIGTAVWATATRTLSSSSDPTAATIADAVWDEARSGHVSAGTFGEGVVVNSIAAGAVNAAAVATGAIDADALASDAGTEIGTAVWATAARTLTAATNVTSTGAAVPITGGGLVSADVTAISADTAAADNAESFFDGTGYAGTGNTIPSVTVVNGLATGAITATAIAADAIGASELATDAVAEIAGAVWDKARSSHTTAGTFGQGVASVQGNVTGSVASVAGNVSGSVASVTGNVGGNVTGSVGSVTGNVGGNVAGSVASVTGNVSGSVGSLAAQAKADVNAEVVDVLATDTYAEPGGVPAATSSLKDKIGFIFTALRNKRLTTATTDTIRNDADSAAVAAAALTDDGTTFTRGEYT